MHNTHQTLIRSIIAAAAVLVALPTAAAAQDTLSDAPDDITHSAAITGLDSRGVFEGTLCGEELFCPWEPLSRAHMAVWLVRVLDGSDPAPVTATRFSDVPGDHRHAAFIERLAELGVTAGCDTEPVRYCPDRSTTRAQMATLLVRAFKLDTAAAPAGFSDVPAGGAHAANIDALAASGITVGCSADPQQYCPADPVARAQMATFLVRAEQHALIGSYREPTVVLDNGWVVYGTDYVPPVHPDTQPPSWVRGTDDGRGRPDDAPRRSPLMRAWLDWCGTEWRGCERLQLSMVWALDYLGANPQCVVQHYEWRAHHASRPGVSDGWNNYRLRNQFGWHKCATVIDPIQPNGRLLSDRGLSVAERCRAVLPADVKLEEDTSVANRGVFRHWMTCDEWGAWVEDLRTGAADCENSARLAEEWMEHFHAMPENFWSISC